MLTEFPVRGDGETEAPVCEFENGVDGCVWVGVFGDGIHRRAEIKDAFGLFVRGKFEGRGGEENLPVVTFHQATLTIYSAVSLRITSHFAKAPSPFSLHSSSAKYIG